MKNKIFAMLLSTEERCAPLILRLGLAVVLWPHGAQKMFGWFGGSGISDTLNMFSENMGIPAPLALLVIFTEFFGPILLVLGLFTRLVSLAIGVLMTVAALMVHVPHGFFMNWTQDKAGEGFEYHILAPAIALALVFAGGGRWAADACWHRRLVKRGHPEESLE
jgi:putative oxidoreductase